MDVITVIIKGYDIFTSKHVSRIKMFCKRYGLYLTRDIISNSRDELEEEIKHIIEEMKKRIEEERKEIAFEIVRIVRIEE